MKIFISQPMRNKSIAQIKAERAQAVAIIRKQYPNEEVDVEILNTVFEEEADKKYIKAPLLLFRQKHYGAWQGGRCVFYRRVAEIPRLPCGKFYSQTVWNKNNKRVKRLLFSMWAVFIIKPQKPPIKLGGFYFYNFLAFMRIRT